MTDRGPPHGRRAFRVRHLRRAPERRQVDADQRARRREGRHHQRQAADDATRDPRHPEPPGRSARDRRHPRHPQAAHAARRAAQRPRRAGARRRRRDRVLRARDREGRPRRPPHRRVARRLPPREEGRDRHQDGCRVAASRSPSACWRSTRCARTGPPSSRCPRSTREQLDVLTDELLALMPEGPALYADGVVTDESIEDRIAEIIREAALDGVRDELPHSIAVTIEDIAAARGLRPHRHLRQHRRRARQPEGDHHRPQGLAPARRRRARARAASSRSIGSRVYLSLHVRVAKEWQRDPKQLGRLGFCGGGPSPGTGGVPAEPDSSGCPMSLCAPEAPSSVAMTPLASML